MVVASSSPSFPHHPVFLFASLIGMTELHGETMPPGHGCSELRAISTATPGPPLALSGQRSIGGARAKQKLARHDARGSGHWSPDHRSRRWGRERRGQYRRADAGASEDCIAGASARRRRTNSPVSYVPSVNFNLFVYSGRYYTFHDGSWFFATSHSGPWVFIAPERVPRPVVAVPVNYYKIPPGHAKKMERRAAVPAGPPSEGWCPPGQAKKGRC